MDSFKGRQFRNQERGNNPEAEAAEVGWQRIHGLYQTLLEKSKDRVKTRVAINAFVEELRHLYSEDELRTYRAYNLLCSSTQSGPNLDFPDNRIQRFLDDALMEEIKKAEKGAV